MSNIKDLNLTNIFEEGKHIIKFNIGELFYNITLFKNQDSISDLNKFILHNINKTSFIDTRDSILRSWSYDNFIKKLNILEREYKTWIFGSESTFYLDMTTETLIDKKSNLPLDKTKKYYVDFILESGKMSYSKIMTNLFKYSRLHLDKDIFSTGSCISKLFNRTNKIGEQCVVVYGHNKSCTAEYYQAFINITDDWKTKLNLEGVYLLGVRKPYFSSKKNKIIYENELIRWSVYSNKEIIKYENKL